MEAPLTSRQFQRRIFWHNSYPSQKVRMRQSKFTETQIIAMLKEAHPGRPVNEIWRKYGISSATYYKWKAKYGGLEVSDLKRLRELEHEHLWKGFNSCLDTMQAAILGVKLRHLDAWNEARRRAASTYDKLLAGSSVATPQVADYARHVFHLYVVRTTQRKKLQAALDADDISHSIHYPTPVHLQPAFVELNYPKDSFPVAESIVPEILSLPMFPEITEEQIRRVVSACLERD